MRSVIANYRFLRSLALCDSTQRRGDSPPFLASLSAGPARCAWLVRLLAAADSRRLRPLVRAPSTALSQPRRRKCLRSQPHTNAGIGAYTTASHVAQSRTRRCGSAPACGASSF
jgi:hypothetical protein